MFHLQEQETAYIDMVFKVKLITDKFMEATHLNRTYAEDCLEANSWNVEVATKDFFSRRVSVKQCLNHNLPVRNR